jgi:hypothetical protein
MTDLVTGPAGFLGSQLTASITVHGNDVHGDADEDTPMRREPNPYSQSKVDGELLLRRMIEDENAPVTIVRPGWINDEPVTQCEFLGAIATELGAAPPARRAPYRAGLLAGVVAETAWKLAGREQAPPVTRYGLRLLGGETASRSPGHAVSSGSRPPSGTPRVSGGVSPGTARHEPGPWL